MSLKLLQLIAAAMWLAATPISRATAQSASERAILPPLIEWSGESEQLVVDVDDPWITPSEASGLVTTPTYDETLAWLKRLVEASPNLHSTVIGTSAEQRDILMVIASQNGARTPTELRENGNPTLLAHAGIHSGEIDGKDAGMMLLRDLTVAGKLDLLDRVNLLFIPILNVDGHERSSPYNRINQRGPAEMGWRTNRRNLNLNRDFSKLDTEEVAALVLAINDWEPDLYLDLHVTDGADYQADATYGYNGPHAWSPRIASWMDQTLRPSVDATLENAGHVPARLLFAANGVDMSGGHFEWTAPPRFSTGYSDARHLPHILLENHSLKPYRRRVLGTYVFLKACMQVLAGGYETLRTAVAADKAARPDSLPLNWSVPAGMPETMAHRGIRSTMEYSDVTGSEVIRWLGEPVDMEIPIIAAFEPIEVTARPEAYYIPAAWADIALRLMTHGIEVERVLEQQTVRASMYHIPEASIADDVFEGHVRVDPGELVVEERDLELAPGSYIVRTNQALGDLAMLLLEPRSPDSFFQWGFFLESLQRTEYVEDYVMEPMARAMIEENPALRSEFEAAVQADSAFAADPQARLQWFYRRTPFFDEEFRLYPVGRSPD